MKIFLALSFVVVAWFGVYLLYENQSSLVVPTNQLTQLIPSSLPLPNLVPTPTPTPVPIPAQKHLTGGVHVFQTFNNCGPASLSMALSHYQISVTQQSLGQLLRPFQHPQGNNDDKSVTLPELAEVAQDYGLLAFHRPAGSIELIQQFIASDIPVITRTWLNLGEDIGHYRVVVGYDQARGVLIQDDSLQGNDLRYSYADFNELWRAFNYEFLVLVRAEQQDLAEAILGPLLDEQVAWKQARALSQAQIQQDSADVYAHFNLSVAHYQLGNYQDSVAVFEAVESRLPPRMLWYQIDPILAYYQVGEFERVLSLSQRILDNHNRAFSELHYLQGLIFDRRGQTLEADAAFTRALQYNQGQYWRVNLDHIAGTGLQH